MKGLEEYIKVHGKHFTLELASNVTEGHYTFAEIYDSLQKKVYYNVSGCIPGDIVYIVNSRNFNNRKECLSFLLRCILYVVGISDVIFDSWASTNESFDITSYI